MKKILAIMMLFIISCSSCIHRLPGMDGQDVRDMMSSTVQVKVHLVGTRITKVGEDKDGEAIVEVEENATTGWTGSGVVVDVDYDKGSGESLIMSAAYVSNISPMLLQMNEKGQLSLFVVEQALQLVTTLEGADCQAEEIWTDVLHDVGVLKASCIAGDVVGLADELPPVGAMVTTSGAAWGYHPNNVFIVTDGRFVGFEDGLEPQLVLTVPVAPGHSGSGVFYKGEVFGIISRHFVVYEHVTFAVALQHMHKALDGAREIWNAGD